MITHRDLGATNCAHFYINQWKFFGGDNKVDRVVHSGGSTSPLQDQT